MVLGWPNLALRYPIFYLPDDVIIFSKANETKASVILTMY
jgi:hypothetical protein